MGEISSKSCIDALQGSNSYNSAQSSSKNNMVLVNPEIHLHSANSMSGSLHNDERLKELKEELKTKQDEIDKLRGIRKLEERERNAEHIKINNLLSEKENQIQDQNDLLSWHSDIVKEKRACLDDVYLYGQSEKRIRMEHEARDDGFQHQANKRRNQKKNKHPHRANRSLTNNYPNRNGHKFGSQRTRSKTEFNYRHDPMEFWEWNGTKWVMNERNGPAQNAKQNGDPKCSKASDEPQQQNSVEKIVPATNKGCDAISNDKLQTDVLLTNKMCDNAELGAGFQRKRMRKVRKESTQEASKNVVHCLNDTAEKEMDSHHRLAVTEATIPTDVSISFDEREITRFMNHDVALFGMPDLIRQP